jgi:tyrosyl-tRNA synthetase
VEQGGVAVNGEKITDVRKTYTPEEILADDFVLKRGKKKFCKIIFAE